MGIFGFMRFKKDLQWKVVFKNSKGIIKSVTIVAENKLEAYKSVRRQMKKVDIIDVIKA